MQVVCRPQGLRWRRSALQVNEQLKGAAGEKERGDLSFATNVLCAASAGGISAVVRGKSARAPKCSTSDRRSCLLSSHSSRQQRLWAGALVPANGVAASASAPALTAAGPGHEPARACEAAPSSPARKRRRRGRAGPLRVHPLTAAHCNSVRSGSKRERTRPSRCWPR